MSVREIVMMGDPVLREVAQEVDTFDDALRSLVRDMFETMYHAEGIGLAAPQIGISSRILVIDLSRDDDHEGLNEPIALVNPRVAWESTSFEKQTEGCLSIPGLEEVVERPSEVRVKAMDLDGNPVSLAADKLLARALQHEIDHLDGVLFLDRVSPLKRRMLLKKWKKLEAEEA